MQELLRAATEYSVMLIDTMALIIIVVGSVDAFFSAGWVRLTSREGHDRREVWLRFGRFLVAGLTFQLAADIIETSIAPSWDDIGRLAAIAAIRTFLNYFLDRDLIEMRERQAAAAKTRKTSEPRSG